MIIVIHHSADFDGLFCREVARKHFGESAEYLGWDYGDRVPSIPDDADLYLLDISIEPLMGHPRLTWIDHHKTAIDKFGPRPGLQIDGVAACRLAWQYWFGIGDRVHDPADAAGIKSNYTDRVLPEPLAVRLAGEFDVWDKRDERADVFQYGLKSCYLENRWQTLVSLDGECPAIRPTEEVEAILRFGEIAKGYADNTNAEIMKACGFDLEFEGLHFLALNTARCNSLTFQSAIRPDHDALLGFRFDGRQWTVSLYGVPHRPDLDLSAIAQKYGGGGHRQACGFQTSSLPFFGVGEAGAVFAFMGWLTSRDAVSGPFSCRHEAQQAAELADAFCKSQGWEIDDATYPQNLCSYPVEIDPSLSPGCAELRGSNGQTVRIVNIGDPNT